MNFCDARFRLYMAKRVKPQYALNTARYKGRVVIVESELFSVVTVFGISFYLSHRIDVLSLKLPTIKRGLCQNYKCLRKFCLQGPHGNSRALEWPNSETDVFCQLTTVLTTLQFIVILSYH